MNKKIIIPICLIASLNAFSGCNTSNEVKLQKNITNYVTSIEKNISESYIPTYNDLSISAFTDIDNNVIATNADIEKWTNILSEQKYTPRYTSTEQMSGFNNYISKLENIYVQMNDSVSAVGELNELKDQVDIVLNKLKTSTNDLKKNKSKISDMQLSTSNELLKETLTLSQNLSNNNLEQDVNILKQHKNNLLQTSTISTKYIKIINAIDSNITSMKNIYQSIVQINSVLNSENFENKVIDDNHYISSEILNTPVGRDEYISQFEKDNPEHFENELLFKPSTKDPMPYKKDPNAPTPLSVPYKRENLPFVKEEFENKNKIEYL